MRKLPILNYDTFFVWNFWVIWYIIGVGLPLLPAITSEEGIIVNLAQVFQYKIPEYKTLGSDYTFIHSIHLPNFCNMKGFHIKGGLQITRAHNNGGVLLIVEAFPANGIF